MHQRASATLRIAASLIISATTVIITGCGGGSGSDGSTAANGSSSAPPPVTTPAPTAPPAADPVTPVTPADPEPPVVVTPVPPPGSANAAPTISARPATRVPAGAQYRLAPAASDADGDVLAFSIENRPAWATFSTATGELTGAPGTQHAGTYADIRISVSDGRATAVLPTFTIAVTLPQTGDGLTLSWDVPQQTASGAALGESVTGYRIHYGAQADVLIESVEVPSAGTLSHTFDHLPAGTYYFAVRAITASGKQGELSNVVSGRIG